MTQFHQYGDNHGVNNFGEMRGTFNFGGPQPTAARDDYEPIEPDGEVFDVAFSFAGTDRAYVEATRIACAEIGLSVMYDRDHSDKWWGENFIAEQRKLYGGGRARFFVPFISAAYFTRKIPADEFAAAMWEDVERGGGYILPVLIGGVRPPRHLLPRHVGYLVADEYTPHDLAAVLRRKVDGAT